MRFAVSFLSERTKTIKTIFEEKIRLNEKITNLRKYGLSKQAKFLYVFTIENFDVTTRPFMYNDCISGAIPTEIMRKPLDSTKSQKKWRVRVRFMRVLAKMSFITNLL